MNNVILAGVGGQGTVLAAKVLAYAAAQRGWGVRTAETIGMAQRGGSVVSHVRIGDNGEEIYAPLIPMGTADVVMGFEPGEAARALPYLAQTGTVVTATSKIEPVTASLATANYEVEEIFDGIRASLQGTQANLVVVDDDAIINAIGGNRKMLNTVMLASATKAGCLPIGKDELCAAIRECVKPAFVDMNLTAIDTVFAS